MIDPNKVTEAVSEFLQNPGWNEVFTNAPGGAMERLAISFYFSKFHDSFAPEDFEEYRNLREELERSLDEEDLTYLIENTDKPQAKQHYEELLQQLQGTGGKPTGQLKFDGKGGEEETAATEGQPSQTAQAQEQPQPGQGDGEVPANK